MFSSNSNTCKLANEGTSDWRKLSTKLKNHETSNEDVTNMSSWIDLEMRLLKNKTIDKDVQEQINRDREHWKSVLLRIIATIGTIGKINLAFKGKMKKSIKKVMETF